MSGSLPFPISLTQPYTTWTPAQWIAAWESKADTNNPDFTGGLLIGTGTVSGFPYQFQSAINIDPSTGSGASGGIYRQTSFQVNLSYASTTTNVWEGVLKQTFVNGPGTANGEINLDHAFLQVNVGATVASSENYEASTSNYGTIGQHIQFLSQPINRSTGTVTSNITSFQGSLLNDNPAAGSVAAFFVLNMEPMAGAGSAPTNYFFLRGNEPLASISTKGGLSVGGLSNPGPGHVLITGPDNAGGTYPFVIKSLNGTNCFFVGDDAVVHFHVGSWDQNGNLSAVSIGNGATALQVTGAGSYSANDSVATVLGSVGPTGSHTAVQEWLTIKNASGVTRYIPAF